MKALLFLVFSVFYFGNCFCQTTSKDYVWDARKSMSTQNYFEAIGKLNKAIELDPKSGEAYRVRASAKDRLNDYVGAKDDYQQAIDINPLDKEAYSDRAGVESKHKDFRAAIKDCKKAIEIDPSYAGAYSEKGFAEGSLGMKDQACRDLSKAGQLGDAGAYIMITEFCN